jgi:hypothetical protein
VTILQTIPEPGGSEFIVLALVSVVVIAALFQVTYREEYGSGFLKRDGITSIAFGSVAAVAVAAGLAALRGNNVLGDRLVDDFQALAIPVTGGVILGAVWAAKRSGSDESDVTRWVQNGTNGWKIVSIGAFVLMIGILGSNVLDTALGDTWDLSLLATDATFLAFPAVGAALGLYLLGRAISGG